MMNEENVPRDQPSTTEPEDVDIKNVKVGAITIPLNLSYVKSPLGIVTAVSGILSLLCAILVSASYNINCYAGYGSTYDFFEFVSTSWFILTFFRYIIFLLTNKNGVLCGSFVPWTLLMMANTAIYIIMFFFGSIAMAVSSCWRGGYKASAAFGFFTTFTCIAELVLLLFRLRKEHEPTQNRILILMGVPELNQRGAPPPYDPESNMAADPPKY
ncbi:CKLF-like MARVEL transmembrane domain-containing protein 7 [Ylistrum balloti]|uniref:CKLF-like MARVEL transmembrane domain-containing protein 7 n=1 Tax=Ylistrum balloti TaxID=509963 RepID=UPI0029059CE3|nr:CKLF-like MARVEL transmembrane domain-containing protein 7 [Ylistrum balloti]